MGTSQTTGRFKKPGNFYKNQILLLVAPRNNGFYAKTLNILVLAPLVCIWIFFEGVVPL